METDAIALIEQSNQLLIWIIALAGLIFLTQLGFMYVMVLGFQTAVRKVEKVEAEYAAWEPTLLQMKDELFDLKREMVARLETFEGVASRVDTVVAKVDDAWEEYDPKLRKATDDFVAVLEIARARVSELQETVGPTVRQLTGVASAVREGLAIFRAVHEKTRKRP